MSEPLRDRLRECERQILEEALIRNHGNILRTARSLGVPNSTLKYKLVNHNFLSAWIDYLRKETHTS